MKYQTLFLENKIFPENKIWHFIQIDILHEMLNLLFWEKIRKIASKVSAEFTQTCYKLRRQSDIYFYDSINL